MQTPEDILIVSHNEGIRDKVINFAAHYMNDPKFKHFSMNEIYQEAYNAASTNNGIDVRVWSSSLLSTTEYSFDLQELIITFNNGARYKYKNFSNELYSDFLNSESKGNFFASKIKSTYSNTENFEKL